MNCSKGSSTPEVWVVVIVTLVLLVLVAVIWSEIKSRRKKKEREKSMPFIDDAIRVGVSYNVFLNDGRSFLGAKLLGTSDSSSGQFAIGGWEGMLIILQSSGKRAFVKQSAVRIIEEA